MLRNKEKNSVSTSCTINILYSYFLKSLELLSKYCSTFVSDTQIHCMVIEEPINGEGLDAFTADLCHLLILSS